MKVTYRNCEIECHREKSLGGDTLLFYSVFDKDGFEVDSGFSTSEDTVRDFISSLKKTVDEYIEHPEYYDDSLLEEC